MSSVTFAPTVGGDGSTVTDDTNPTTGLGAGGHRARFVPALAQTVAVAAHTVAQASTATTKAGEAVAARNEAVTARNEAVAARDTAVTTTIPALVAQVDADRVAAQAAMTLDVTAVDNSRIAAQADIAADVAAVGAARATAVGTSIPAQVSLVSEAVAATYVGQAQAARDAAIAAASDAEDTAASFAAPGGSERVEYDGGTVQDVLDSAKALQSYTPLRAYQGRATSVRLTAPGIAGQFLRLSSATGLTDNGGTLIIDGLGRAWQRVYDGPMYLSWFQVPVAPSNGTAGMQNAINAANALYLETGAQTELVFPPARTYLVDIVAPKSGVYIVGRGSKITPTSATAGRFYGENVSFLKIKGLVFQQTAGFNYWPAILLVDGTDIDIEHNDFTGCGYGAKTIRVDNVTYRKNTLKQVGIYPRPSGAGADFSAAYDKYGAGLRAENGNNINFKDNYFENDLQFGGHTDDITGGAGAFTTFACNDVTFTQGTAINAPGQGFMSVGEWQFTNVPGMILAGTFNYNLNGRNIRFIGNYARGCNQEGITSFGCGKVTMTGVISEDNGMAAVEAWASWAVTIAGPVISNKVARAGTVAALNIVDTYGCAVSSPAIRETVNCGFRVGGAYAVQITGGSVLEYGTGDNANPFFSSGINVCEGDVNTDCSTEIAITGVTLKRTPLVSNTGSDIYVNQNGMVVDISGNNAVGRSVSLSIGGLTSAQSSSLYTREETAVSWGNTLRRPIGGIKNQRTASVGNSATDILNLSTFLAQYNGADASLVLVNGAQDGNIDNAFADVVLVFGTWGSGSAIPVVISSINQGSPSARTYTRGHAISGGTLRLSMASGTYSVRASALQTVSGGAGV